MNEQPRTKFHGTTIFDVIADGKPYGDVAARLKVDHHNFFSCKVLDRYSTNLSEIALFENTDPSSILDSDGNLIPEAKASNFVQIAIKAVEEAFDDGKHPLIPDDITKTPELVENMAVLLVRSALANAHMYRQACAEIIQSQNAGNAIENRADGITSGKELCPSFAGSSLLDENNGAKIAQKYYDHDLSGKNSWHYGLMAYHLAMTIMNPHHEAPTMCHNGFQVFYNQINPERQKDGFHDTDEPQSIAEMKMIPR